MGFVGGEVDKLIETKGMDAWDKHEAQKHAKERAERMYEEHYGQDEHYNPNHRDRPHHFRQ